MGLGTDLFSGVLLGGVEQHRKGAESALSCRMNRRIQSQRGGGGSWGGREHDVWAKESSVYWGGRGVLR